MSLEILHNVTMKEEWRRRNSGVKGVEMLSLPLAIDWFLFSPLDVSRVVRRVVFRFDLGPFGLQTNTVTMATNNKFFALDLTLSKIAWR